MKKYLLKIHPRCMTIDDVPLEIMTEWFQDRNSGNNWDPAELTIISIESSKKAYEIAVTFQTDLEGKDEIDMFAEFIADPDDDGNYPIEYEGKSSLVYGTVVSLMELLDVDSD